MECTHLIGKKNYQQEKLESYHQPKIQETQNHIHEWHADN